MPGPMEGIRVVELGVWVAGPAPVASCRDWGADVVKIEPPAAIPRGRSSACSVATCRRTRRSSSTTGRSACVVLDLE